MSKRRYEMQAHARTMIKLTKLRNVIERLMHSSNLKKRDINVAQEKKNYSVKLAREINRHFRYIFSIDIHVSFKVILAETLKLKKQKSAYNLTADASGPS